MSQEQCLLFQPAGILISSNSTADRDSVNSGLEGEDHDFYHHLQAATSFTNFEEESSFEACTLIPVKSRNSWKYSLASPQKQANQKLVLKLL
jgi:hypothetical protein